MAKDGESDPLKDIPHERKEERPDFSKPPPRKELPKELQKKLNDDDSLWMTLYEGEGGESTDSSIRYAAYASRIRTILLSAHRYVAYTSDIGESFRPIAHPRLIKGAYGVSWAYLAGDVAHEGYKAYVKNQRQLHGGEGNAATKATTPKQQHPGVEGGDEPSTAAIAASAVKDLVKPPHVAAIDDYRAVMAQRAVFQGLASMGLPAFTIHSIVRYSGRALRTARNTTIRTYGPIGLGLAAVPFLPYVFDKPVEEAVEWTFHKGFELVGGPAAVAGSKAEAIKHKKEL